MYTTYVSVLVSLSEIYGILVTTSMVSFKLSEIYLICEVSNIHYIEYRYRIYNGGLLPKRHTVLTKETPEYTVS